VADPEVDLFAGMKKKKKKQVVLDVEDTPIPAAEAHVAELEAPKAAAPEVPPEDHVESGAATPVESAAPAEDGADLFADMKKKKKKKKDLPLELVSGANSGLGNTHQVC
jgi:translation initiation factor 2 subunit 2